MVGQVLQLVYRECNKIKKIANALSQIQTTSNIPEECDKIFYSVIKIEKSVKKLSTTTQSQKEQSNSQLNLPSFSPEYCQIYQQTNLDQELNNDDHFSNALRVINKFETTMHKVQRKVNILLNEAHFNPRIKRVVTIKEQETEPKKKIKNHGKIRKLEQEEQEELSKMQEIEKEFNDRSLHAIDQEIYAILEQLDCDGEIVGGDEQFLEEEPEDESESKKSRRHLRNLRS